MLFVVALPVTLSISYGSSRVTGRLIHQKDSLYHRIFVHQRGSVVTLRFNKMTAVEKQSEVDLSDMHHLMLEYSRMVFCGLLYNPEPQRVLVVGLGGGVIPREMRYYFPELEIDVAEIDGTILPIAKEYFGFREDEKLKVHIEDGRMFIKKQLQREAVPKYDIIVLDAFNSEYIPFHLMTKEFLEQVKGVLADDGVVAANVFYSNRLYDAELKTFLDTFGRCQAFYGKRSANAILAAPGPDCPTLSVKEAVIRAKELQQKHRLAFDMLTVARQLSPEPLPDRRADVLTDDRAPVNWLRKQERISR